MSKAQQVDRSALEQRAAELRQFIEQPDEKQKAAAELAAIEQQVRDAREGEFRAQAEARLVGIRRAYGSVAASLEGDEKRVREAVREVEEAIERLNQRYVQVAALRAEAAGLCDRFGLTTAELPHVPAPAVRDISVEPQVGLLRRVNLLPRHERCEHRMRGRRSYAEIVGSEGYRIIEAAGLKPWPGLTERQREVIAERQRQEREAARLLAEVGETVKQLDAATDAVGGKLGLTSIGV